ncbi:MAG: hypothetical protein FDZ75_06540 [Actinobacteria bacterium]|nr:MAG: hypothetical protein FDZ75_06540 [Actinomycetota bacterium]
MVAVAASIAITAVALAALPPGTAQSAEKPGVVIVEGDRLYPCTTEGTPKMVFDDHEAFLADYARVKQDLVALRHAIDHDVAAGYDVGPSLHEWADHVSPGTFGGGSKP